MVKKCIKMQQLTPKNEKRTRPPTWAPAPLPLWASGAQAPFPLKGLKAPVPRPLHDQRAKGYRSPLQAPRSLSVSVCLYSSLHSLHTQMPLTFKRALAKRGIGRVLHDFTHRLHIVTDIGDARVLQLKRIVIHCCATNEVFGRTKLGQVFLFYSIARRS